MTGALGDRPGTTSPHARPIEVLTPPSEGKPKLRGVLHQWAAVWAAGAAIVLVAMAPTGRTAAAAGLYGLSLVVLFAISAVYHRVEWSPVARARMRRLDHASIFILIAGTYTPVAMLGLSSESGERVLWLVWTGAMLGVVMSVAWVKAPKVLTAVLCVGLGWILLPYLGEISRSLNLAELVLIATGGIAYTLGAVAYAAKWPNLRPGVFGYHEFFHACTLVGAATHLAVVVLLIRQAA